MPTLTELRAASRIHTPSSPPPLFIPPPAPVAPVNLNYRATENLVEKYRPRVLSELVGQDATVRALRAFIAAPYPNAFLFSGETGTGKTSAALALANELGCDLAREELGGVWQIASGEQTVQNVRDLLRQLHCIPFYGSGWRVCIINEADYMAPQAEAVWLDALENLPARTVIVFTTNAAPKLSSRFKDRCDGFTFASEKSVEMRAAVTELVRRICQAETGSPDTIAPQALQGIVRDDAVSFRRVVQTLSKMLRAAAAA